MTKENKLKLCLNSAYGKFAQNLYQAKTHCKINEETCPICINISEDFYYDTDSIYSKFMINNKGVKENE